ncbi:hypothetical protein EBR25_02780 [bacterium]|nr:hypothetical protein [bacterium]
MVLFRAKHKMKEVSRSTFRISQNDLLENAFRFRTEAATERGRLLSGEASDQNPIEFRTKFNVFFLALLA